MVSPISTANSQSMQTGLSLLSQVVAPGASEATTTPASTPALERLPVHIARHQEDPVGHHRSLYRQIRQPLRREL